LDVSFIIHFSGDFNISKIEGVYFFTSWVGLICFSLRGVVDILTCGSSLIILTCGYLICFSLAAGVADILTFGSSLIILTCGYLICSSPAAGVVYILTCGYLICSSLPLFICSSSLTAAGAEEKTSSLF
jgi:hypothetical protein